MSFEAIIDLAAGTETVVALTSVPLDERKGALLAALAALRWTKETAGFLWQRPATAEIYYIATDEAAQGKLGNERRAAEAGLRRPGDVWKCGDPATGKAVYIELDDAEIIALSAAARARTSDLFNHEATLADLIDAAGDADALAAIDISADWTGEA